MKSIKKTAALAAAILLAAFLSTCRWGETYPAPPQTPPPEKPPAVTPPVATNPGSGNEGGITLQGAFGWEAGKLGALTETITGGLAAVQYFHNKGLSAGWNLGNSLDSSPTSETTWSNPEINQAIFNGVKAQGFNVVRIPITWGNNTANHAARLNRVAEVVKMAHQAGLVVIINTHHDNGWFNLNTAATNQSQRAAITSQFKNLWTSIAEKFKDYGEWLIFEALNEPREVIGGTTYWDGAYNNPQAYNVINEWNKVFTDAVRATGGNNAKRMLQYNAYAAKPKHTYNPPFDLPADSALNRQIVSFHYYWPEDFCLEGSQFKWSEDLDDEMESSFSRIRNRFGDDVPIVIGECGATYQGARAGAEKTTAENNRKNYYAYLGKKAKEYHMVPVLWDNGSFSGKNSENFGLFNRETGVVNSTTISGPCIQAIVNAVKR